MFSLINAQQILAATLILFSIIDIVGTTPIIINLKKRGSKINPIQTVLASGTLMILFLYFGDNILSIFGVDVSSFAITGSIILFIIGLEMILGVNFFKSDPNDTGSMSVFPIAFPFIAGAGSLTTIISLRAEYEVINILIAILINLVFVFLVIRSVNFIQRVLGRQGEFIVRKVFGIILLSIAIKLFKTNVVL